MIAQFGRGASHPAAPSAHRGASATADPGQSAVTPLNVTGRKSHRTQCIRSRSNTEAFRSSRRTHDAPSPSRRSRVPPEHRDAINIVVCMMSRSATRNGNQNSATQETWGARWIERSPIQHLKSVDTSQIMTDQKRRCRTKAASSHAPACLFHRHELTPSCVAATSSPSQGDLPQTSPARQAQER